MEFVQQEEQLKSELVRNLRWEFVKLSRTAQNDLKKRLKDRLEEYTNVKNIDKMIKLIFDSEKMNIVLMKWKKKEHDMNSSNEF